MITGSREPLPIEDCWAHGGMEPLPATAGGVVHYDYHLAHTLGSLSGPVTFRFDPLSMTVGVRRKLEFDFD